MRAEQRGMFRKPGILARLYQRFGAAGKREQSPQFLGAANSARLE
jgi:hypothetical protein